MLLKGMLSDFHKSLITGWQGVGCGEEVNGVSFMDKTLLPAGHLLVQNI